jgi:hypothetical protein
MRKKKMKPTLLDRRILGMRVTEGRVTLPSAGLVYEEFYDDGTKKIVYGNRVFGVGMPGKARVKGQERPDLFPVIQACAVLFQALENACASLDARVMDEVKR